MFSFTILGRVILQIFTLREARQRKHCGYDTETKNLTNECFIPLEGISTTHKSFMNHYHIEFGHKMAPRCVFEHQHDHQITLY